MRKNRKRMSWLLHLLLVFVVLTSCGSARTVDTPADISEQRESETSALPTIIPSQESELQVHFLDVGQGDCTLITCDGEAMLIDAGDNDQGTKIQLYLEKQGISELKYVIGTHPDADHIGGLDVILYKFDCQTILMPQISSDTAEYRDVVDTMEHRGYQNTPPVVGDTYWLGSAEFTVISPGRVYSDTNNSSVAILLQYGSHSFLFTGDAEQEAENDMVNSGIFLHADVYQAGHHGSSTSSSEAFLNAVSPQYAVISCAEGNSYGHPHAEIMDRLRSMGVLVYRTDEQGTIVAVSNGENLQWNCRPSETWKSGEASEITSEEASEITSEEASEITSEEASGEASEITSEEVSGDTSETDESGNDGTSDDSGTGTTTYVCNTNTGKFHIPSCSAVDQMADHNRLDVTWTRQECIDNGYVPCKRCNP